MKIGVISDTHDHLEPMAQAVKIFKEHKVGQIVHCGDWVAPYSVYFFGMQMKDWIIPVHSVFGNNEGDVLHILKRNAALPNPVIFADVHMLEIPLGNVTVAVYHGHDKDLLDSLIGSDKYTAVFTGHTHKVRNELIESVRVLNPGSLSYAVDGEIVKEASVAVYDTETNSAEIIIF